MIGTWGSHKCGVTVMLVQSMLPMVASRLVGCSGHACLGHVVHGRMSILDSF